MARVRERQLNADEIGVVPVELRHGPSVQWMAPDEFVKYPTPPQDQDELCRVMLKARRNYNHFFQMWCDDMGFTPEEGRQHKVHRRPYWPH